MQWRIVVVFKHQRIYVTVVTTLGHFVDLRATAGVGVNSESVSPVPSDPMGVHRIILEIGVPRTKEDWGSVYRWGRTTLPHGLFQEDDRLTSIRGVLPRP